MPAIAGEPVIHTHRTASPPTTAYCKAHYSVACYSPNQYQKAYELTQRYSHGNDGRGITIAIVDSFGSPTIAKDLATFDTDFHLPKADLQIIHPAGAPPAYNSHNKEMVNWAGETSLDVEYAHAIAPGAKLLLVETPEAETEGPVGLPDMMFSERYVVRHHLADVISQSFGATEATFHSPKDIRDLRYAFTAAQAAHVTVVAAAGDAGATSEKKNGVDDYPRRENSWPSSDPLVTSVGGTQLHLSASGARLSPDVVWNDGYGAGGGGTSAVFGRPSFQDAVRGAVGSRRGTPDISMTAAVNGGALVYSSYPGEPTGYNVVGGSSEATPIFAGVVALADQHAGHDLGDINARLYGLAGKRHNGIVDVTRGNNSFDHVKGYAATKGFDLASGWGTVNANRFVTHLG